MHKTISETRLWHTPPPASERKRDSRGIFAALWNRWVNRPANWSDAIEEQDRFLRWVKGRSGNVYQLIEDYLRWRTGKHVTVSYDWMACEGVHAKKNGVWDGSTGRRPWMKRWERENGSGNYGTHYDGK